MFPRCLEGQRGMVSREYWGESLQESTPVVKENKSWSELVPGFQIVESGTFHYLNAWCRIGVDEPIRWLSKKKSSTKTEPQSPNQSSVHWSVPRPNLFVRLKCVTRLYSVQWERWHFHVMSCNDGGWCTVMMGVDIWWGVMLWILNVRYTKRFNRPSTIVWLNKYLFYKNYTHLTLYTIHFLSFRIVISVFMYTTRVLVPDSSQ